MVLGRPRSSRVPSRVGTGKGFSATRGTGAGAGGMHCAWLGGLWGPGSDRLMALELGFPEPRSRRCGRAVAPTAHGLCHQEEVEEQSCSLTRAPCRIETPRGVPSQWVPMRGWGRGEPLGAADDPP